jgi:hypothetical protein
MFNTPGSTDATFGKATRSFAPSTSSDKWAALEVESPVNPDWKIASCGGDCDKLDEDECFSDADCAANESNYAGSKCISNWLESSNVHYADLIPLLPNATKKRVCRQCDPNVVKDGTPSQLYCSGKPRKYSNGARIPTTTANSGNCVPESGGYSPFLFLSTKGNPSFTSDNAVYDGIAGSCKPTEYCGINPQDQDNFGMCKPLANDPASEDQTFGPFSEGDKLIGQPCTTLPSGSGSRGSKQFCGVVVTIQTNHPTLTMQSSTAKLVTMRGVCVIMMCVACAHLGPPSATVLTNAALPICSRTAQAFHS